MLDALSPAIWAIFAALFIAVVVELVLNYWKGWGEDGESQGKQGDAKRQGQKDHATSHPQQQENDSNQKEPVYVENEVQTEEKFQETTTA
jgi:hypothetical protein